MWHECVWRWQIIAPVIAALLKWCIKSTFIGFKCDMNVLEDGTFWCLGSSVSATQRVGHGFNTILEFNGAGITSPREQGVWTDTGETTNFI